LILRFWQTLLIFTATLGLAACAQATPPPTQTPPIATEAPATLAPTPTALPTRAPLPTEIPRDDRNTDSTNTPTGTVRVIHGTPGLGNIDVLLGEEVVAFGLRYGRTSGQPTIPAGDYNLMVRPTGNDLDAPVLLQMPLTVAASTPLLIVIARQADNTLTALTHIETTTPIPSGQTRISFIHAIPNGPETTVLLPKQSEDDPQEPPFPPIRFGQMSDPYLPFLIDMEINLDGFFDAYPFAPRPRRSYTLTLVGSPEAPEIIVTEVRVEASTPITVVNLSQPIGPIDVYMDGVKVSQDPINFKGDGVIRDVITGTHDITMYPMDADPETTSPLLSTTLSFTDFGENYLVLMGPADDLTLINHQERDLPLDQEETRITLINAVYEHPVLEERRSTNSILRVGYAQPISRTYITQGLAFEFATPQSNPNADFEVIEFIPETTYNAGRGYIIFVTGQDANNRERYVLDRVLPQAIDENEAEQSTGYVYVTNATTNNLEIEIDGDIADSDVPPKRSTLAQILPPGEHTVTILDADTGDLLSSDTISTQVGVAHGLIFFGGAGSYNLLEFPIGDDLEFFPETVPIRMLNVSGSTTRPLAFAYMPAVDPERRLSNVIDSPQTIYPLPPQVPRIRGFDPVTSGQASRLYVITAGQFDIHIYGPGDDRLYASTYDVVFEENKRYEIVVRPNGNTTLYDAFVVEVPIP
jgi:hypothetical protein